MLLSSQTSVEFTPVLALLAEEALKAPLFSVAGKEFLPPSGDKRDYLSIAPYWHPAEPGKPWVRRDGIRNADIDRYDRKTLENMTGNSIVLILAFAASGEGKYRERARELLRHFFLDPETRMNPHLQYGQFIPGICEGRGIGIIETVKLLFLADALELLPPHEDDALLRQWFADYLDWLLKSPHGRDECGEHNNHGTWYDAQCAGFALFVGRKEVARERLASCEARIAPQVTPEGRQPHEEARTLSLFYSTFNLLGFLAARNMARNLGETFDAGRPEKACGYLSPYWEKPETWPHTQLTPFDPQKMTTLRTLRALQGEAPGYSLYSYAVDRNI